MVFDALTSPQPSANSTRIPSILIILPSSKLAWENIFSIRPIFSPSESSILISGVLMLSGKSAKTSLLLRVSVDKISIRRDAAYKASSKPNQRSLKKICPLISPANAALVSFNLAFIKECPDFHIKGRPPNLVIC